MTGGPPDLPRLVRRDVTLVAAGVVLAGACVAVLAVGAVGWLDERRCATAAFVAALAVVVVSLVRWAIGPPQLRRDRTFVLAPAFLATGPLLWSLQVLGGGAVVAVASGAVGFTAAAVLGMAWSSRRG